LVVVVMGRSLSLHREWVRILTGHHFSERKMKTKLIVPGALALAGSVMAAGG
jgi:hypothetical protein